MQLLVASVPYYIMLTIIASVPWQSFYHSQIEKQALLALVILLRDTTRLETLQVFFRYKSNETKGCLLHQMCAIFTSESNSFLARRMLHSPNGPQILKVSCRKKTLFSKRIRVICTLPTMNN